MNSISSSFTHWLTIRTKYGVYFPAAVSPVMKGCGDNVTTLTITYKETFWAEVTLFLCNRNSSVIQNWESHFTIAIHFSFCLWEYHHHIEYKICVVEIF